MSTKEPFKRLNFFTGFFTTAKDWRDGETYHIEKRKLHNRGLHTPGVLSGVLGELEVVCLPSVEGLKVGVKPGAALDASGNLILLHEKDGADEIAKIVDLAGQKGAGDSESFDIYVAIQFDDRATDIMEIIGGSELTEFTGSTRITEEPDLRPLSKSEVDDANGTVVTLARVTLRHDTTEVKAEDITDLRQFAAAKVNLQKIEESIRQQGKKISVLEESTASLRRQIGRSRDEHHRGLHTPGIVYAERNRFDVEAHGGRQIRVRPGMALDSRGRLMALTEDLVLEVPSPSGGQAALAYVKVRADTARAGDEVSAYPGVVRVDYASPAANEIELARIHVQPSADSIAAARDGDRPGANEIDRTHVVWAGAVNRELQRRIDVVEDVLFRRLNGYQLALRRRHNQGLHTPGIVPHVGNGDGKELNVVAHNGFEIKVQPGMAIDSDGNELFLPESQIVPIELPNNLPRTAYVAISQSAAAGGEGADIARLYTDASEAPRIFITWEQPDNQGVIELARIRLQTDVVEKGISDPPDLTAPGGNQIDRRSVTWAGSHLRYEPETLSATMRERLIQQLSDNRGDFGALAESFPVGGAEDVRHAMIGLEMLARTNSLRPETLPSGLSLIAQLARKAAQQIAEDFPPAATRTAYKDFDTACEAYVEGITGGAGVDDLLNQQNAAAEAARTLSTVQFRPPTARFSDDQIAVKAIGSHATITLSARRSRAYDEQKIVKYTLSKRV